LKECDDLGAQGLPVKG